MLVPELIRLRPMEEEIAAGATVKHLLPWTNFICSQSTLEPGVLVSDVTRRRSILSPEKRKPDSDNSPGFQK